MLADLFKVAKLVKEIYPRRPLASAERVRIGFVDLAGQSSGGRSKIKRPECGDAQTRPSGEGNLSNVVRTLDRIENPISVHTVADAPVQVYRAMDIRAVTRLCRVTQTVFPL